VRKILVTLILLLSFDVAVAGYLVPLGSGVKIQKIHVHNAGGITMWFNSADITIP